MLRSKTYTKIYAEMSAQHQKWGEQNHDSLKWLAIATEELGELAQAINDDLYFEIEKEAVQLVAVMCNWLDCIDRQRRMVR